MDELSEPVLSRPISIAHLTQYDLNFVLASEFNETSGHPDRVDDGYPFVIRETGTTIIPSCVDVSAGAKDKSRTMGQCYGSPPFLGHFKAFNSTTLPPGNIAANSDKRLNSSSANFH